MHGKLRIANRKSQIANRLAGFTLAEVVVACTLLAIAIIPILKALTTAQVSSTVVERKTRSLILAQAKLDAIRARSIHNYDDDFGENDASVDGSYLCIVLDQASSSDLRQITVKVGYDVDGNDELADGEVAVELETLIARRLP